MTGAPVQPDDNQRRPVRTVSSASFRPQPEQTRQRQRRKPGQSSSQKLTPLDRPWTMVGRQLLYSTHGVDCSNSHWSLLLCRERYFVVTVFFISLFVGAM
jgi:hypothetical protein